MATVNAPHITIGSADVNNSLLGKVEVIENSNETSDSMLSLRSDGRIYFHSKEFSREVD